MKIGIISDTHNNIELTQRALQIFREQGAALVLHAGDFTSPKMLRLFADFTCRFVFGNGDIDLVELNSLSEQLGFGSIGEISIFEAGGKSFVMFHGNNVPMFRDVVASGAYDYIIKGHTHHFENYRVNKSRIINPGSIYGGEEGSVAILDTETDRVERIRIEEE